jgi:hypothetical protein
LLRVHSPRGAKVLVILYGREDSGIGGPAKNRMRTCRVPKESFAYTCSKLYQWQECAFLVPLGRKRTSLTKKVIIRSEQSREEILNVGITLCKTFSRLKFFL